MKKKKPSLEDSILVHLAAYHMGVVNRWKEEKRWKREICINIYNSIKDYEKEKNRRKVGSLLGKENKDARPRTVRGAEGSNKGD
jgi:hypothetical protein